MTSEYQCQSGKSVPLAKHKLDLWCKATRSWGMKISGGKVKISSLLLM